MKKVFLKKIKKILQDQKNELIQKSYKDLDIDIDGDETDQIQGSILALVNDRLSSRDKQKINQIEVALRKIEENRFGICDGCGEDISEKRLMFNPSFNVCINCAEDNEILIKNRMKN
jgi:DnaK suppressor protein